MIIPGGKTWPQTPPLVARLPFDGKALHRSRIPEPGTTSERNRKTIQKYENFSVQILQRVFGKKPEKELSA